MKLLFLTVALRLLIVDARLFSNVKNKILKAKDDTTTSVVAGAFDFSPENDRIAVKLTVAAPKEVTLFPEDQKSSAWYPLEEPSPLKAEGYSEWKATPGGFRFKKVTGAFLECGSDIGTSTPSGDLLVSFECSDSCNPDCKDSKECTPCDEDDAVRFRGRMHRAPFRNSGPGVFNTVPMSSMAMMGYGNNAFWQPTENGRVPYGWSSNWGTFNYPYYAYTAQGCLGCNYLTPEYTCQGTPMLFPFSPFTAADILPYSVYYTSGCCSNWDSITAANSFGSSAGR